MFWDKICILSRFAVMMYGSIAGVGGKLSFLGGTPLDLSHCILHHSFAFKARTILIFSTIPQFQEFGRGVCSRG